jgi:DNA-binding GntR family transcriptional regulator
MVPRPAKQTRADVVRNQMRGDILAGRLKPGERLMFPNLCERYGASVGVTREALTWLISQGLVRSQPHHGHIVTPLSPEDLDELTTARVAVEPSVLRSAIARGDVQWEAHVVSAHHLLARTPRADADDPARASDAWGAAHTAFHDALFSGSRNERLLAVTRSLAVEACLYWRWAVPLEDTESVAAEHEAIFEAAVSRDADRAAELLAAHIASTAQLLISHADEQPVGAAVGAA